MDFQQPHGYLRPPAPHPPPPPPMADPYHHQPQSLPPPPPPNPWYSTQFQFQQQSSSPPPPPPPHHHHHHSSYPPPPHQPWPSMPAHPHSDHFASGHPPPPPYSNTSPYSSHHAFPPQHNHYPPALPHQHSFPPLPPRPHVLPLHQIPQSYPQVNQDWGNANWGHHQSWDYQANTNEEGWAAKARAWAAAKTATDSQQAPYVYAGKEENVSGDPTAVFSGQDASLSPLFHQQEVPSSYSSVAGDPVRMESVAATTYVPPSEPAVMYSSLPAVTSFQVEHSATLPSPLPGHSAPIFGRMPAPSFHATVSSISPSFAVGAGPNLHSVAAFSGDAYGVSGVPERPKKASVPNWLREEIIKKKPVLFSSAGEHPKEDALLNEDEGVDKSYIKDDMADSKSADSSRSTEEEEEEDELEAARTAAINQEIKRVLTEVLLKVTDELFDEIATKVLNEDDLSVEGQSVGGIVTDAVDKEIPVTSVLNGSAKVVAPYETKETKFPTASEKSAPSSPGDLLGLASYASDDEEDDGNKRLLNERNMPQQIVKNFAVGTETQRDDDSFKETKENHESLTAMVSDLGRIIVPQVGEDRASRKTTFHDSQTHRKMELRIAEQVVQEGKLKNSLELQVDLKAEKSVGDIVSRKSEIDDQETRAKSDKSYRHEERKNSVEKDHKYKDKEVEKDTALERGYKNHNKYDKRIDKTEKRSDQKVSRDRLEDKSLKSAETAKDSDSRGRSPPDYSKGLEKEKDNGRRASVKDDSGRKKERTRDVERDESRRTNGSSSSRHKRRRSSSVASRDRDNNASSVVSHASDSSNESSDYSKRKLQSKRHKSPSPETVRSRKRQVSRSPHSKHSQHRHSSYSSLEASRKRRSRSRSRSPVRRRR